MARRLGADDGTVAHAARAGLLAKCDLVTHLVGEFPELQGYVGSEHARADGEPAAVCDALDWQYRHEFADGVEPAPASLALLLAETLDIVCRFGTDVGLPTGNADPFGVRRAAIAYLEACERFAPAASARGKIIRKVVPAPSWLSTSIRPRAVVTKRCTAASPSPVPRPFSLVVKKGLKMLPRSCSGIPAPVSATSTTASPPD